MERYFDAIYAILCVAMLLALADATFMGFRRRVRSSDRRFRQQTLGIASIAIGTALALLGGLVADAFLMDSPLFQQFRFGAYDVGFALIVAGLDRILRASPAADALANWSRAVVWLAFLGTLSVSVFFLANPRTFVMNQYGLQIQLTIYWLPLLTATLLGAVLLLLVASRVSERRAREHLMWIGAFAALLFVGLLRESLIMPGLGSPLANLLVAFVPFVAGSLCLCAAVRNLPRKLA